MRERPVSVKPFLLFPFLFLFSEVFLRERLTPTGSLATDDRHLARSTHSIPSFLPELSFYRSPSRLCRHQLPSALFVSDIRSVQGRWVFSFSRCCYLD